MAFQILAALLFNAGTTKAPSGENAAEFTNSLWPPSVNRHFPVVKFRILTALCDAVTTKAD